MMLYTGLGIGEHPNLKGLWAGFHESTIRLEEHYQGCSQVFSADGYQTLLTIG